jgi:hypothetical protein
MQMNTDLDVRELAPLNDHAASDKGFSAVAQKARDARVVRFDQHAFGCIKLSPSTQGSGALPSQFKDWLSVDFTHSQIGIALADDVGVPAVLSEMDLVSAHDRELSSIGVIDRKSHSVACGLKLSNFQHRGVLELKDRWDVPESVSSDHHVRM